MKNRKQSKSDRPDSYVPLGNFSIFFFSISARQLKLIFHKASPMDFHFESIARSNFSSAGGHKGRSDPGKLSKQIKLWPQFVFHIRSHAAKSNSKAKAQAKSKSKSKSWGWKAAPTRRTNKLEKVSAERCQQQRCCFILLFKFTAYNKNKGNINCCRCCCACWCLPIHKHTHTQNIQNVRGACTKNSIQGPLQKCLMTFHF